MSGSWTTFYTRETSAGTSSHNPGPIRFVARDCFFLLDKSTFSTGEVDACLKAQPPVSAVFDPAFFVVVEGYTPAEMGITSAAQLASPPFVPAVPSPFPSGMVIAFSGPVIAQDPLLPPVPQRFTFPFSITFTSGKIFGSGAIPVALSASFSASGFSVASKATITLTPSSGPFMLQCNQNGTSSSASCVSPDIRTFQVVAAPGNSAFNASIPAAGNVQDNAIAFIQAALTNLRSDTTGTLAAEFNNLPLDEDSAILQLQPNDPATGDPVYNFALARVRLPEKQKADNVRVFFRLWQAQQTNAEYNSTTCARAINGEGQPVPVLGVQGGEIVTIPFFAQARQTPSQPLHLQRDDFNRHDMDASAGETNCFFGCWLDVNQPDSAIFPQRIVGINADGPFDAASPLFPIQQFMVGAHPCLAVEIACDTAPVNATADPANSGLLAQRNLTFVGVPNPGNPISRRVPQTFEVRPATARRPSAAKPDELMIEWNSVPADSFAEVYFPAASADSIIARANMLYASHLFEKIDAHTLRFPAAGVTYIPIPEAAGVTLTGLLTLDLPFGIHPGETYTAVVRQITSAQGFSTRHNRPSQGRRTTGAFKLTVPISTKALLLEPEERRLSIMKWVSQAIHPTSRWYPVMQRYLRQIVGRVTYMGGNPAQIPATGTGVWKKLPEPPHFRPEHHFVGKIESLVYDTSGNFEAFTLETMGRVVKRFESREQPIAELAKRAWQEHWRVQVVVEGINTERPSSIALLV